MRTTTPEKLVQLQKNPSNIRNICILAHVDHGKTTLADALVASNGIISQRMAGKLRYMDSREDEQTRGITMKSSAISLAVQKEAQEYLVNLIDSPGHVDFSSEVSTAVRLCDGAVVVVDVVEGVCPQTHAVLRQAWLENIKPVLVFNKLDRLIMELKMDPLEAFFHLQVMLEQVNLVTNELFTTEVMAKTSSQTDGTSEESGVSKALSHDWTIQADDEEEERNIFFSPNQGNVVFASAYDGWGFTINRFADMFSKKLGINKEVLQKTLWGDFYLNSKTKRIMKGAQSKVKKPLFVQFILENIWAVYESVSVKRDAEMTEKIVKSLDLKILPRDMRHNDPRVKLQAIMGQWLSVSRAVLDVVVDKLPSPLEISEDRVEKLMCSQAQSFLSFPKATQELKDAFIACSTSDNSPVILFVSKMFPVERKMLPQFKQRPLTEAEIQQRREQARQRHLDRMSGPTDVVNEKKNDEAVATTQGSAVNGKGATSADSDGFAMETKAATKDTTEEEAATVFVAFARIYSGTVKKGQSLYVLGPKHDPSQVEEGAIRVGQSVEDLGARDHITAFTVSNLFLFMGRELEHMEEIPAGNILGIGGLEDHILKSGTVSSTVMCPAFTDLYFDASPIVRVALEPKHAGDMGHLVRGLKLLNQADPCVQVLVQETGEHVIITAGEVHLQRCLDDLRQRYANIELHASSPIVPFRETIINPPKMDMVNEVIQDQPIKTAKTKEFEDDEEVIETGVVEMYTTNQKCCIRIRALPLPDAVTNLLEENLNLLKTLHRLNRAKVSGQNSEVKDKGVNDIGVKDTFLEALNHLKSSLSKAFAEEGKSWTDFVVDKIWAFGPKRVGPNVLLNRVEGYDRPSVWDIQGSEGLLRDFDSNIVSGFQMATIAGPLCEEPLRGVCFVIEKWEFADMSYARLARMSESDSDLKATEEHFTPVPLSSSIEKTLIIEEVDENGNDSDKDDDSSDEEVKDVIKLPRRKEYGPFSGQIISCVIAGCRKAFQTRPQRLMVAMYKCNIQATSDVLGKLYAVLGKRNGSILEGDMTEGSQTFNVVATLPVIESFGFAENIRKKTSGLASPQLVFSHWQVLDVDPFWVPTTEEEYLHFGEKADSDNKARQYVNAVRKRKGLKVDEKIVEHAEKQRTLTRNK